MPVEKVNEGDCGIWWNRVPAKGIIPQALEKKRASCAKNLKAKETLGPCLLSKVSQSCMKPDESRNYYYYQWVKSASEKVDSGFYLMCFDIFFFKEVENSGCSLNDAPAMQQRHGSKLRSAPQDRDLPVLLLSLSRRMRWCSLSPTMTPFIPHPTTLPICGTVWREPRQNPAPFNPSVTYDIVKSYQEWDQVQNQ